MNLGEVLLRLVDFEIYDLTVGSDFIKFLTTAISIQDLDLLSTKFGTNKIGVENLYDRDLVEVTMSGLFHPEDENIF